MIRTLLFSLLSIVCLVGCEGPLDSNTPRKVTPITSAIKVTPNSIRPSFSGSFGTFELDSTQFIEVDTTTSPMAVWMKLRLKRNPEMHGSETIIAALNKFEVRKDSALADAASSSLRNQAGKMWIYLGDNNGLDEQFFTQQGLLNSMDMVVSEPVYLENGRKRITITVFIQTNKDGSLVHTVTRDPLKQDNVFGTIVIEV